MNRERQIALAQVEAILIKYADKSMIEKLPKEMQRYIYQNKAKDYQVNLKPDVTILEQDLLHETKVILSILYQDYWKK